VLEELDAPSEWFFDPVTQTLYLFNNASVGTPPPSDGSLVFIGEGRHLFNITGTMAAPVRGISIMGLGLRDTAYTYMDPHSLPSGGDWSLERSAVVFLEGTENVTLSGCVFERVDGNAVLLSAYNRNASIVYNEFVWIGATAVALWGNTESTTGADSVMPEGYGADGTSGNQPRFNTVAFNLCHELGVWEKQSSCYTQFKSGQNNVFRNIMYNGPRAHINVSGERGERALRRSLFGRLNCASSTPSPPFLLPPLIALPRVVVVVVVVAVVYRGPSVPYSVVPRIALGSPCASQPSCNASLPSPLLFQFNDGFAGGANVEGNLVFNSCRESSDHGPMNSWDRDPYLFTDPISGAVTTIKFVFLVDFRVRLLASFQLCLCCAALRNSRARLTPSPPPHTHAHSSQLRSQAIRRDPPQLHCGKL
jgi:hypothetical protein